MLRPDRAVVAVFLGVNGLGDFTKSFPHPDHCDPVTGYVGTFHRLLALNHPIDRVLLLEFKNFVRSWCDKYLEPLRENSLTSFDRMSVVAWLETTEYPQWRREELLRAYDRVWSRNELAPSRDKFHYMVSSFWKDEFYEEYKNARMINSRSDYYKCLVGPIAKAMERSVFDMKRIGWFIKKVPVVERAKYVFEKLFRVGGMYFSSDFTSFESSIDESIMDACEMVVYERLVSGLAHGSEFLEILREAQLGPQVLKTKYGKIKCKARRMSGEMVTSLGNGLTNILVVMFSLVKSGCEFENIDCVVEGDDGLFVFSHPHHSASKVVEAVRATTLNLGFDVKLKYEPEINTASFCGLVFDPVALVNIADPVKVVTKTVWGSGYYKNTRHNKLLSLLKMKALSTAYQYNGCPIICAYAYWLLRRLRNVSISPALKYYQRDQYEAQVLKETLQWANEGRTDPSYAKLMSLRKPVLDGSRTIMFQVHSIPAVRQREIDDWFDMENGQVGGLDFPEHLFEPFYPESVWSNTIYLDPEYHGTNPELLLRAPALCSAYPVNV